MSKYYSFQKCIKKFFDEKKITEKNYRLIMYLYTKESLALLSAYEVYLLTHNEEEFIDTLFEIEKIEFFGKPITR